MARFGDFDQYLDNAGDPLVSGKIYFYESGTTTFKTTYADVNNSIPNTNPVILTAAGRQPNVFFDGVAKAVLTNSSDVQIAVRDPVGQTESAFGDQWVATKIYNATDVVLGSNGVFYRSLTNGNQNNNPINTSGFWTLLYSVEWNAGITYSAGDVVLYGTTQYQSLQDSNLNQNPSTVTAYWASIAFAWLSTRTYAINENVVGTDGILYTSLQNSNIGNVPASSGAYWVGTSAAAAASATASAASAAAALVSENAAAASESAAATSATNSGTSATASAASASASATSAAASDTSKIAAQAAQVAAELAETNAETAETNSATSATASATSAAASLVSQNAAAGSATAAAASASAASGSSGTATTKAAEAAASAAAALVSENAASASASTASTQAGIATTKAGESAASAIASASSATASASSATASAASATTAAATLVDFEALYLGEKASDPTVDNQGGALVEGALYFNTTTDTMRVYTGSAWANVAPTATSIDLTSQVTGVLPIANGGTNLSALGSAGQILAVNAAGNALEYASDGGGSVTSVAGTGTVNGITLTGTVTSSGNLTLGGALSNVNLASQVTGTLPAANGGTGITAAGTSGNVLTSDGTNWASTAPSTGGGLEATASGVLANGDAVIVNADGTVSIIAGSSASDGLGSDVIYDGYATTTAATYDSVNDKVVVVYMAGASAGSAQVGTVSGSSISFGTKVAFNATAYNTGLCIDFDVNAEKVVVMWGDPSSNLIAAVGTVSGTSISFGAAVTISTNIRGGDIALGYDENAQKHLAFYVSNATGQKAYAVVLTVSGTTLDTVPTAVEFMATQSYNAFRPQGPSYDSTGQKIVIFYNDYSNSESGRARACTISGTTVSFGTPVEFDNGNSEYFSAAYSPSLNKHMVVWRNYSNARYVDSAIATLSGTTITFGTTVTVQSATSSWSSCVWDATASKFVVASMDVAVDKGKIYVGTVTGTSAAFTGPTVFVEALVNRITLLYDPDEGKVPLLYDVDSNQDGTAAVWTTGFFNSNMTATNFIGFSDAAYADGVTATIQLISEIDDAQSGLTAGLAYYVQADGSIAATPDDLSVYAGVAASATKIIIKG